MSFSKKLLAMNPQTKLAFLTIVTDEARHDATWQAAKSYIYSLEPVESFAKYLQGYTETMIRSEFEQFCGEKFSHLVEGTIKAALDEIDCERLAIWLMEFYPYLH